MIALSFFTNVQGQDQETDIHDVGLKMFPPNTAYLLTIFFVTNIFLGYAKAGKLFFEMAKKSWDEHKDPYPIWGTCLGFELLALLGKL